jgi:hypothetical protein
VKQNNTADKFSGQDVGYTIFLYFAINAIRFAVVFLASPLLRRTGYGLTYKEMTVISFSGLRGAVSLALALIVDERTEIAQRDRDFIKFHTGAMVMLTTLINGTTMEIVYKWLKLYPPNPYRQQLFNTFLKHLEDEMDTAVANAHNDWLFCDAHFACVASIVPSFRDVHLEHGVVAGFKKKVALETLVSDIDVSNPGLQRTLTLLGVRNNSPVDENENVNDDDVAPTSRVQRAMTATETATAAQRNVQLIETFYNALKGHYEHQFEQRALSAEVVAPLVEAANAGAEVHTQRWTTAQREAKLAGHEHQPASAMATAATAVKIKDSLDLEWQTLVDSLPCVSPLTTKMQRRHFVGVRRLAEWRAFYVTSLAIEQLAGFIDAHIHLRKRFIAELELARAVEKQIQRALHHFDALHEERPFELLIVATVLAARRLLQRKKELIEDGYAEGMIVAQEKASLINECDERLRELDNYRFSPGVAVQSTHRHEALRRFMAQRSKAASKPMRGNDDGDDGDDIDSSDVEIEAVKDSDVEVKAGDTATETDALKA